MNGLKGQRVYVGVKDATDMPRAGKVLSDRLWLADHGYYAISKSSCLLDRCLVDTSVWQPERLDFAAGAICSPPLRQDRGKPVVFDGPLLDTKTALPDLNADEAKSVATLKRVAREALKDEQQLVRAAYIEDRAREIAGPNADDDTLEKARNVFARALDKDVLTGEFPIVLADGRTVTVGEMLDDPNRYHLVSTRDPLEPDYNNGHAVGKVYLFNGRPTLSSFAHGKRVYKLIRQPSRVELVRGALVTQ
ncbi:MAG: hypothetical protein IPM37_03695 [Hahellaceae bacterium]|nr:hypothetical protein [Hahellaceae bacterium]